MGKINIGRVVLGGLLAGVVINIGETILNTMLLRQDWADMLTRLNLPPMEGTGNTIGFMLAGFVLGIFGVWLYAAIRPRFTPGPMTAVIAGIAVWFACYLYSGFFPYALGLFTAKMFWTTVIWGIFETSIAIVAGAWLYKEM